ncbi:Aminotransferase [Candidatus Terasakiella magnetica]|uniref:Probable branched-chain-amino-acid aminotransferase n=1 Tax=Candidatus Terasakiella magnetica TaxID=1867952 RepID=A0A1C3RDL1_9PROT|nr:branched-chain amino acid aminotransferase [Candidatus Terasakiella magnetica]SCA55380.1 Aminotransferase [Candidatus Terasakiella magnetica]
MGNIGSGLTWTYFDGAWTKGNPHIMGPRTHGVWLSSTVFDGARAFDGVIPDLDLHCQRAINSARILGMAPMLSALEIADLSWEGVTKFPSGSELYVCPMFYGETGFITPDPASTRFVLSVFEAPLPQPNGFSACKSSFRRPARDMAPTDAKASCLYPNVGRCVAEANEKGFDTAVVLDPVGNVAEFAYTNLFYVKDGRIFTPQANGTFLNGITRQRVIKLAKHDGLDVIEKAIEFDELFEADEIFGTGNYFKVGPLTKLENQEFAIGEITMHLRELYFDWAKK